MKKQLTAAQLEQRRANGRKVAQNREHMRAIGKRGYDAACAKLGGADVFHSEGGYASQRAQNEYMIRAGYFPNQSLSMWGMQ